MHEHINVTHPYTENASAEVQQVAEKNVLGPVVLYQGASVTFVNFGVFLGVGALLSMLHIWFYLSAYAVLPDSRHIFQLILSIALSIPVSSYVITRLLDLKTWIAGEKTFWEYIRTVSFGLWGGLIGGISILIGFAVYTQTPLLALLDGFAVGIPLGQMMGRLGCLNYGCCHGRECSQEHHWGIRYFSKQSKILRYDPKLAGKRVYPTQLYSAIANFLIYVSLLMVCTVWSGRPEGFLAGLYMSLYGLKRFGVEFLRGEFPRTYFYGLTLWQWLSLAFLVGGLGILSVVVFAGQPVSAGDYAVGFQSVRSSVWMIGLMSIVLGLAFGTHGKKIGSW